jgi:hypothetical protein
MENLVVGLIRGRHDMPCDKYIFDSGVRDIFDYKGIRNHIKRFIRENIEVECNPVFEGCTSYGDTFEYKSNKRLIVYVTGLSCVLAELISACVCDGIDLTLMHYNAETEMYEPQEMRFPRVFYNSEY